MWVLEDRRSRGTRALVAAIVGGGCGDRDRARPAGLPLGRSRAREDTRFWSTIVSFQRRDDSSLVSHRRTRGTERDEGDSRKRDRKAVTRRRAPGKGGRLGGVGVREEGGGTVYPPTLGSYPTVLIKGSRGSVTFAKWMVKPPCFLSLNGPGPVSLARQWR